MLVFGRDALTLTLSHPYGTGEGECLQPDSVGSNTTRTQPSVLCLNMA